MDLNVKITPDGRYIAFMSYASDMTTIPDTNDVKDVFVRDMQNGTTVLASMNVTGSGSGSYFADYPSISSDGHYVSFISRSDDLAPNANNGITIGDVFIRDLRANITQLVSVNRLGTGSGNGDSFNEQALSADGRYLTFISKATDLVAADTVGENIFVRDLQQGKTKLVSQKIANANPIEGSGTPIITPGGEFVAFTSFSNNFVAGDANNREDVFLFSTNDSSPIGDAGFFVRQHYRDFFPT